MRYNEFGDNMNLHEAIGQRHSCRHFLMDEISQTVLSELQVKIETACQNKSIRVELRANEKKPLITYGFLNNVRNYLIFFGRKKNIKDKEICGHIGEDLVLFLTMKNLGSCFVGGSYDVFLKSKTAGKDEDLAFVIAFGAEANQKNKGLLQQMTFHKSKPLTDFIDSDMEIPKWLEIGVEALMTAPSAMNRQPIKLKYSNEKLSIYIKNKGIFDWIDLGIAKANVEAALGDGYFELGDSAIYHKYQGVPTQESNLGKQ